MGRTHLNWVCVDSWDKNPSSPTGVNIDLCNHVKDTQYSESCWHNQLLLRKSSQFSTKTFRLAQISNQQHQYNSMPNHKFSRHDAIYSYNRTRIPKRMQLRARTSSDTNIYQRNILTSGTWRLSLRPSSSYVNLECTSLFY